MQEVSEWREGRWHALGLGIQGTVRALAVGQGGVYAGGDFIVAGGMLVNHIAFWNGSSWEALGAGLDGSVYALAVHGNVLYAGGAFGWAGTSPRPRWPSGTEEAGTRWGRA